MGFGLDRRWTNRAALGMLSVVSVGTVIAGRVVLGAVWVGPAAPITYVGIVAGAVAGVVMTLVMGWRAAVEDDQRRILRMVQWGHITYFAVGGGVYPAVMGDLIGLPSGWYAALPGAVLTAVVWSELLFAPAAVVYVIADALPAKLKWLDIWLDLFWFFMVYGLLFGLIMGLSERLWLPALTWP